MSEWKELSFNELYKEPSRNGLTNPKRIRGTGYKFINMGEIFAYDRLKNIPTDRVPLTEKEKELYQFRAFDKNGDFEES